MRRPARSLASGTHVSHKLTVARVGFRVGCAPSKRRRGFSEAHLDVEPITRSFCIELNRESMYASTTESSTLADSEDEPTKDS